MRSLLPFRLPWEPDIPEETAALFAEADAVVQRFGSNAQRELQVLSQQVSDIEAGRVPRGQRGRVVDRDVDRDQDGDRGVVDHADTMEEAVVPTSFEQQSFDQQNVDQSVDRDVLPAAADTWPPAAAWVAHNLNNSPVMVNDANRNDASTHEPSTSISIPSTSAAWEWPAATAWTEGPSRLPQSHNVDHVDHAVDQDEEDESETSRLLLPTLNPETFVATELGDPQAQAAAALRDAALREPPTDPDVLAAVAEADEAAASVAGAAAVAAAVVDSQSLEVCMGWGWGCVRSVWFIIITISSVLS